MVTLTGTDLHGTTKVTFTGTAGTALTVVSTTSVTVDTPPHGAGTTTVKITNPGANITVTTKFKYVVPAPSITTFTPAQGPGGGGTVVTFTGTHLGGTTKVKFGTVTATGVTVTSTTSMKATTPAHLAGTVKVHLTNPNGNVTAATSYEYLAPTISSFTPASGSTTGGTVVTITGTDLHGTTEVTFTGTAGTALTVVSTTTVKVTTPAHGASTVTVHLTNPGADITAAAKYKYVAGAPVVTTLHTGPGARWRRDRGHLHRHPPGGDHQGQVRHSDSHRRDRHLDNQHEGHHPGPPGGHSQDPPHKPQRQRDSGK